MGCLTVKLTRAGGDLKAQLTRASRLNVRLSLVCPTALGSYMLLLSDGTPVLTQDGGYIYVKGK